MKLSHLVFILLLLVGSSGLAAGQAKTPEGLVAELYKLHDAEKDPFAKTKDRPLLDKYFAKTIADLIWRDFTEAVNEVGAIDADPLYNSQDPQIKNLVVGKSAIKGNAATVAVNFTNTDQKVTITFELSKASGVWKIENILYGDGDSLLKWLKDTYSNKPAT